jgi:thymidine kinase
MSLELIVGPMFAGKTSLLISKIEIFSLTGKRCVIIRSPVDTRTDTISTHRNIVYKGEVMTLKDLSNLSVLREFDVIGIDEGHFFDALEMVNFVDDFIKLNKILFVTMLKSNYKREPFMFVEWLYARATDITLCKSVCEKCREFTATNTKRRNEDENDKEIVVGGKEMYYPCCDKCWED